MGLYLSGWTGGKKPKKTSRPADFDEYWNASLAEMRAMRSNVELILADFTTPYAECFDLYFTGIGGARIHALLIRPRHARGSHPAVVMFHGYSSSAGNWLDKLPYAAMGYTVAALDCRGQAGLSEDPGHHPGTTWHGHIIRGIDGCPQDLMYRSIFLDAAQLAYLVMDMDHVDPTRVGATGASQGGGLTLACAKKPSSPAWATLTYSTCARASAPKSTWQSDCVTRSARHLPSLPPTIKSSAQSGLRSIPTLPTRNSRGMRTASSSSWVSYKASLLARL